MRITGFGSEVIEVLLTAVAAVAPSLLVLDDLSATPDMVAFVRRWVSDLPATSFLVASSGPLGVDGEVVVPAGWVGTR